MPLIRVHKVVFCESGQVMAREEGFVMIRLVELADGTFRITIEIVESPLRYKEEFRFNKIEDDETIPEKDGGFRLVLDDK